MFDKPAASSRKDAGVRMWPRTYTVLAILNLTIAASFYLVPLVLGFAWNNSAGLSILNVHHEDRRYPATNITAEPWGASVLLGPAESRLRQYFAGRNLPLWNPYQGMGEPYAAQGDGSPYSLPALARALLPPWAGNLVTFGVFAISAAAMFAFLSLLGLPKEMSFLGAVAVFLSTALTIHIARYNIADQNALIPVQFAVTLWAIQRRTPATYLMLAGSTAITMTAGFIQSAVFAIAIASLLAAALILIRFRTWRERAYVFSALIAATLVGIVLSMPFWLPILELSEVGYHKNVPSVVVYRPPPYNLAAFFFPALFGEPLAPTTLAGVGVVVDWSNLFATSSASVLLLCLIGAFACKWEHYGRQLLFWIAIAAVVILALRFMNWPPFSLLSRDTILAQQTTKHTQAITAFLMLFASLLALEQYPNWIHARLRWVYLGFLFIPLIALAAALANSGDIIAALASLHAQPIVMIASAVVGVVVFEMARRRFGSTFSFVAIVGAIVCSELSLYLPLGTGNVNILYARLLVGLAWILACYLILIRRPIFAAALGGAIILCYSAIVALPKHGLPSQVYDRALPAFAEFMRVRTGSDYRGLGIFPNFSSQAEVRDMGVVGPFGTSGFAAFIHSIDPDGKLGFYGSGVFLLAGPGPWQLDLNRYIRYLPIFDWLGVRYLVLERAMLSPQTQAFVALQDNASSSFRPVFSDDAVTILESMKAARRFEFSASPLILRSQSAIIRKLQSDPNIVDRSILLESSASDSFLEKLAASADRASARAEIEVLEENPNYLRLKLSNSRDGIFVVKDSYFPGWQAFVDGDRAPILRVNGMVRGVEVASSGVHIIEFRYKPLSFWYGVFAALIALALLLVLLFWRRGNPRTTEGRLIPLGAVCLLLVATAPAMVISRENPALQLGTYENATAIDLRNVALRWRETDSTNGRELFTRGVRLARIPVATESGREIPLHIGDLVYLPNTGLAEIDSRGEFQRVTAREGTIVPLCRLFETTSRQDDDVALYRDGRWQTDRGSEPRNSSACL